jgi:hypothetical protein
LELTTDQADAVTFLIEKGGYSDRQVRGPIATWLERGDDAIVFELRDLGAVHTHPLCWVMPWERDEPTPTQAPDTAMVGPGWRYAPVIRVTI